MRFTIKIAYVEGKNWKTKINKFLMAYQSTPQVSVDASPYHLMSDREMRTELLELEGSRKVRGHAPPENF